MSKNKPEPCPEGEHEWRYVNEWVDRGYKGENIWWMKYYCVYCRQIAVDNAKRGRPER